MPLPMLPLGLELRCDAVLAAVTVSLAVVQPAYLAANRRYWQGVSTPVVLPRDGNEGVPDRALQLTDQWESWEDTDVSLPATVPCAVAVDVYDSLYGQGYTVRGDVEIAGHRYQRVVHVVGVETWRDSGGWQRTSIRV